MPAASGLLALAVACESSACSDSPEPSPGEPLLGGRHSELLLDVERVQLLEGFDGFTALQVGKEFLGRYNLDRDELPLPLTRQSRFLWPQDGRAGVFRARAARYHGGALADAAPCTVTVTALSGGAPIDGSSATWDLPAMAADAGREALDFREGPQLVLRLAFPEGTDALEVSVRAQAGRPLPDDSGASDAPPASYVNLLSPRVDRPAAPIGRDHVFEQEFSLLPFVPDSPDELVPFGLRTTMQDGAPVSADIALPAWEVSGAFEGKTGRHALTLTGETRVVIPVAEILPGDVLRFGLALDRRMPPRTADHPGARVRVEIAVGDAVADGGQGVVNDTFTLVGSAEVDSVHWQPFEWALDAHVGQHRQMIVTVTVLSLPEQDVLVAEPDYGLREFVPVSYRPTAVRVGLSNLALARTTTVPWRRAGVEQPSVLLVQVETLRADRLAATTADGQLLMPALDALARLGTRYTHALAPSPWTLPSTATLFTGLPPSAHGAVHHDRMVLPEDVPTLAERARAAGVATAAVVTNDLLDPHKGYSRGFDRFADVTYANARQVTHLANGFLEDLAGRQFLLLLHEFDPHHPYRAPGEWRDRFVEAELRERELDAAGKRMKAAMEVDAVPGPEHPDMRFLEQRQRGDIAYFDEHFGRLLDRLVALGLGDTTTVIVTADHGEEFGEQGWYGHGSWLYDECTRVPLVIARAGEWADGWRQWRGGGESAEPDPGDAAANEVGGLDAEPVVGGKAGEAFRRGATIDEVVSNTGLHGEVLRLLDVPYDRDAVRPALSLATSGTAFVETRKGVADIPGQDPFQRYLAGLRSATHLLVLKELKESERADPEEPWAWLFYELLEDGATVRPLPAEGPHFDELKRQLQARIEWSTAHHARPPAAGTDAAAFEALKALGYMGS